MPNPTIGPVTQAPLGTTAAQNTPPVWYGAVRQGSYTDFFDLAMALAPGSSEATRLGIINKALAYWTAEQAAPTNQNNVLLAPTAIVWLTAERARVQSPPPNNLHITYPV